ncbi:MAG: cytochrome c biogenesis protein CcdA [Coriobacteriia bacterium]
MQLTGGMGDLLIAFLAGVLSFLSPCVLPLIPGYLAFITGLTPSELSSSERPARAVLLPSLLFMAGFTLVFVALGAGASAVGRVLLEYSRPLQYGLGAFVAVMGFLMLGLIRIPWLYGEARMDIGKARAFGRGAALVAGMAFALGWTPCVGPILSMILAISLGSGDVVRGASLLSAYSLGLGVPLIIVGLLFGKLGATMGWLKRHSVAINRVAGVFLIILGVLIFFDRLSLIASWLVDVLPSVEVL